MTAATDFWVAAFYSVGFFMAFYHELDKARHSSATWLERILPG